MLISICEKRFKKQMEPTQQSSNLFSSISIIYFMIPKAISPFSIAILSLHLSIQRRYVCAIDLRRTIEIKV
jgi:hypothetical protein